MTDKFQNGTNNGRSSWPGIGQPITLSMAQLSTITNNHGNGGSTSSLGRLSGVSVSATGPRMRSDSQDSPYQLMEVEKEDEGLQAQRRSSRGEGKTGVKEVMDGSGQRKRSRMEEEENEYIRDNLGNQGSQAKKTNIDKTIQQLHNQIEQAFSKGERGKTITNRNAIQDTLGALGLDIFQLLVSVVNLQEEKVALQYQVIQLQTQASTGITQAGITGSPATTTYLQAAMIKTKANNIATGKSLPVPEIPQSLKHTPSEKVLIFKAAPQEKGIIQTKQQQEDFRNDVHNIIGKDLMEGIEVIRPTRNGGHTVIFHSETAKSRALEVFRRNEQSVNVEEEKSCIIAPKRKTAKVVCREPPENVSMDDVLHEFYGKSNMHLNQIPRAHREARIFNTRFGWVFDISSMEAAAIQAQGGRIRYGQAREMKVEEYIPLQQCYNCCLFGHNAKNCLSEKSYCRLCGEMGHAGWDCLVKDDRDKWRCINCLTNNETKGTNLPITHAAAQLHRCPCALNQKELRKIQLSAAGIYTTPISDANLLVINKNEPRSIGMQRQAGGPQQHSAYVGNLSQTANNKKKSRSRSAKRNPQFTTASSANSSASSSTSYSSSSSLSNPLLLPRLSTTAPRHTDLMATEHDGNRAMEMRTTTHNQRAMRIQRPRSYDGWKAVGRQQTGWEVNGMGRGRNTEQRELIISTSQLPSSGGEEMQGP